jgi:hypothetical protein
VAYKDVKPRILIERFIGGEDGKAPYDYKILCFGGEPAYVIVDADRYEGPNPEFLQPPTGSGRTSSTADPPIPRDIPRPEHLSEMLRRCRKLSRASPTCGWIFTRPTAACTLAKPPSFTATAWRCSDPAHLKNTWATDPAAEKAGGGQ